MPEQLLDLADVGAALEEMRRRTVAEGVTRRVSVEARARDRGNEVAERAAIQPATAEREKEMAERCHSTCHPTWQP